MGPAYALRYGIGHAMADVVVVTMADGVTTRCRSIN
jgi:hypothetical protein